MKTLSRRGALRGLVGLAGMTTIATLEGENALAAPQASTPPDRNPVPVGERIGGFALGCQAWSFRIYSAMEAIEKTAQAGGKTIEFFPGQALSKDNKTGLGPGLSDANIALLKAQLQKFRVYPVGFGVTGLGRDEAGQRGTFEFARKMGIGTITSEPDPAAFDLIEKMVREYNIRVAIHNHPKRADDPNYKYWSPEYVLSLVKGRDARIGACADLGHFVRSGIKPVDGVKKLRGRVLQVHLKDLNEFTPGGHDVPAGTGVGDVASVLKELRGQKFDGSLSIEYEYNWEGSLPEIAQSVGFVRGWGQS